MHKLTYLLVVIGAINWLLFGIFGAELGTWLGGMDSVLWKIIYIIIGLAGLYELFTHKGACKNCCSTDQVTSAPQAQQGNPGGGM